MVVVTVKNSYHNDAVHFDRNDSRIRFQKQNHHVAAADVDSLYDIIVSYKIIMYTDEEERKTLRQHEVLY
jgi:hypothetical protein